MDLDKLKGATLDDKTFESLRAHVDDLTSQRDAARAESISGRKGKDTKITDLTARVSAFAERLGVEPDVDLSTLPDAKGQADAAKQYEAKIARLTRELADSVKVGNERGDKLKGLQRETAIGAALDGLRFKNPADARALIALRVVEEGDDLLFKTDDGKLVPVKDGAAWFAKTRPDYVEASDAGGKGSGFKGGGGSGGKVMDKAKFDALRPAERAKVMADGYELTEA